MTSRRQQRLSELLQEELSILVTGELLDPDLADAMVNVTDVDVSPDLRNARVYVQHNLPPGSSRRLLEHLQRAEGFLRRSLAENLTLRYIPHLSFTVDRTEERAQRVDEILDEIAHSQGPGGSKDDGNDNDIE